jgi:hypothetical protein
MVELIVPNPASSRTGPAQVMTEANALLGELRQAHDALENCLQDLDKVLARPMFDGGALTSVRLRLAGLRLTRGPLIIKVSAVLAGKVTHQEAAILQDLRSSHQRLLQAATTHSAKWTLDAISRNWSEYRSQTRDLVRKWQAKAEREQRLVYPLIERCALGGGSGRNATIAD